jgi:hypothetical protein
MCACVRRTIRTPHTVSPILFLSLTAPHQPDVTLPPTTTITLPCLIHPPTILLPGAVDWIDHALTRSLTASHPVVGAPQTLNIYTHTLLHTLASTLPPSLIHPHTPQRSCGRWTGLTTSGPQRRRRRATIPRSVGQFGFLSQSGIKGGEGREGRTCFTIPRSVGQFGFLSQSGMKGREGREGRTCRLPCVACSFCLPLSRLTPTTTAYTFPD